MNRKRQREISYIKLNKKETGYCVVAQPVHALSLAKHFLHRQVPLVKQRKGMNSEDLLEFSGGEDGEYLEKILTEWKERFVSGGEQYW